jgi:putative heme iron utilization protein
MDREEMVHEVGAVEVERSHYQCAAMRRLSLDCRAERQDDTEVAIATTYTRCVL